jgi:hypothetical protein
MPSLYNAADNQALVARIQSLRADTPAQWGKMNVSQMLAHCCVPLQVAFEEVKLPRRFFGLLFGGWAKRKLSQPGVPWDKSLPTDPAFVQLGHNPDFEASKAQLVALVARFAEVGPAGITRAPHPFFGKLTPEEWDALQSNHLNHHLTQFGA